MKFLDRLKNGMVRFFYGRHGMDQLNWCIFAFILVLSFISAPFENNIVVSIFSIVKLVLWAWLLFRMLSKNNNKRYSENAKFLNLYNPVKVKVSAFFNRVSDKEHRYYKCKCGTYLRVPKGKGKIKLTCSKCGRQMIRKS